MVRIGRELYQRGLVVATDGNLSARLDRNRFLTTPSGLCKGWLKAEQLIIVDEQGQSVDTPTPANAALQPTSELAMHLAAYRIRPEVEAIVHAHPPHAIAQSIAGDGFEDCFLPEALLFVGIPPVTPYATPSSSEGAEAIREAVAGHDVLVLQRHGSLALGSSIEEAYFRTESLEQLARIRYLARSAEPASSSAKPGSSRVPNLPPEQVAKLLDIRTSLGLSRSGDAEDFCEHCGVCGATIDHMLVPKAAPISKQANAAKNVDAPDFELVRAIVERVVRGLEGDDS
jgi:L-fuculose-phosphate aldolase